MSDATAHAADSASARQREAADPAHSAWVSANAGTGKTRVLTDRIARLLLRRVRPEKILCLTYTKAAAAEMKNRITDRLGEWAGMDDAGLRVALSELIGGDPAPDDLRRARRLFAATLDAPGGGVNVNTIHAFCQSLLARFPVEAGIPPHAQVMDEREATALQREAQQRIFRRIALGNDDDTRLTAALSYLAGYLQPDDFSDLIRKLLGSGRRFQHALDVYGGGDGVIVEICRTMGVSLEETEDTIVNAACEDTAFDAEGLLRVAEILASGNKTEQSHAPTIRAWLDASPGDRAGDLWPGYLGVYLTGTGSPRSDRSLIAKATMQAHPDVDRAIHAEQDRIAAIDQRLRAVRTTTGTRHLVIIGAALVAAYEAIKRERALLDYDDLIYKALGLLENDKAVSWVHYKLDGGIDHILVDEAQDTSPPQWDIIKNLSLEMFSGQGVREEDTGDPDGMPARSMFAVGDEKQSIYSFQGADPDEFGAARDWFRERAEGIDKSLRTVELNQSFRSTQPVLSTVDEVFMRDAARAGVVDGDAELRHLPFRHDHAGAVELWPAIEKHDAADENPWLPVDDPGEASPLAQTADRIARTIRSWIDDRQMLPSRGRPIDAGDIMILVERRTQFAEEMVKRLKHYGIDVAGADRMKLTEQLAVMDLMAAAHAALLIDDDLTLATVLKGPFVDMSEDDLYVLAHGRSGRLWQALKDRAAEDPAGPWAAAQDTIDEIRARADTLSPFEFFAVLLGPAGGRRRLYARFGHEAGDPIDEFLDYALVYERTHAPSLQGFLRWVEGGANEIKRDMEVVNRAVRVMTVHGAKGLEAPVVILPDTCGDNTKRKTPAIFWAEAGGGPPIPIWPGASGNHTEAIADLKNAAESDAAAENHRLLYVAMTRARDRLHVTGWERGKKAKSAEHGRAEGSWYELIRPVLEELPASEIFDAPGGEGRRLTSPQVAEPERDDTDAAFRPEPRDSEPWMLRPPAAEADPPDPLTPSRPGDDDPAALSPFSESDTNRFRRGRLIHRLLQSLPDMPVERRADAAAHWLATTAPDLDETTRKTIATETLRIVDKPDFADLFGPSSLAEVPIAGRVETAEGTRAIAGQVDRLVVADDAVTVIDYKTNRPPPQNEADVAPAYLRQMAAYRSALRTVYPDRAVRCVLLWTDGPSYMMLSDAALDRYAP